MKNIRSFLALAGALVGSCWLAGCATPEARIKKHPEMITRLAPEQLELVKAGRVAVGFDMDMVRLALGEPDQVRMRATAEGSHEIWTYTTYAGPDGAPLYRGLYHRYYLPGDALHPYYANYAGRLERDRFSVVFKDARVISIEPQVARGGRSDRGNGGL